MNFFHPNINKLKNAAMEKELKQVSHFIAIKIKTFVIVTILN